MMARGTPCEATGWRASGDHQNDGLVGVVLLFARVLLCTILVFLFLTQRGWWREEEEPGLTSYVLRALRY